MAEMEMRGGIHPEAGPAPNVAMVVQLNGTVSRWKIGCRDEHR